MHTAATLYTARAVMTGDPDDAVTSLGWLTPLLIVGGLILLTWIVVRMFSGGGGGDGDGSGKIGGR